MGFGENFVVQTYQVCNFWTMSVTESQKVAKYSQKKRKHKLLSWVSCATKRFDFLPAALEVKK